MSMLAGYKKQGGFESLLMLIEASNKEKQEQFFSLIQAEDAAVAAMIRSKILTVEKIFSWDAVVLKEFFSFMSHPHWMKLLKDQSKKIQDHVLSCVSKDQKKIYLSPLYQNKEISVGDMEAARIQFLQDIRILYRNKKITASKKIPELDISDSKVA